ncbi:hypothetical protein HMPREF9318_00058 [Streptococcus urinalis FB127-CNA-2]|uniref:Uncharacterized protein n=1 Tax=Streptococcus urinalis 2285-97 TaxID=764291 RepID=G5KEG4_9STRE|nr:hypothetical protein [Streptococcus urinalis]QBX22122.1 hypothetical protein Javan637_0014 [Streptococcus phage Javan637]QBX31578.1 hypothetical protein Javan642_0014 [Streptococcus phage Javan642]QBX31677.1 hypothetical protein Javan648_0051 [Streptococcus phage Javan648]EHJ57335.1 hypothetical protein STRUR_0798 [Streptococcus urinalis 2285-97]EKS21860.1 hypothetical protein HMPREF9318_00058 [Streptococcus urinalis FB127-CNA-2]
MTKLLKEIRDLLKEILDELKEPIDLKIDSDEFAKHLRTNIPKDKVITIDELPKRYPEID